MPVTVSKVGPNKYRVSTPSNVHAKGTSRKKAMAQMRLINAVEHSNWKPTGRKSKKG